MFDRIRWFFQRVKLWWQKKTRGFSDEEWWNLDISLAKWIIPRLRHLRDNTHGYPPDVGNAESWDEILRQIILAFELIVIMQGEDTTEPPESDNIDEGLDLFRKYYFFLWD